MGDGHIARSGESLTGTGDDGEMEQWSARGAHNAEVKGSNPFLATCHGVGCEAEQGATADLQLTPVVYVGNTNQQALRDCRSAGFRPTNAHPPNLIPFASHQRHTGASTPAVSMVFFVCRLRVVKLSASQGWAGVAPAVWLEV